MEAGIGNTPLVFGFGFGFSFKSVCSTSETLFLFELIGVSGCVLNLSPGLFAFLPIELPLERDSSLLT